MIAPVEVARGLTPEQIILIERESAKLEREFKIAEDSYGTNHLDFVLAKGYLAKLLGNMCDALSHPTPTENSD